MDKMNENKVQRFKKQQLPFIYRHAYNIDLFGIEKIHPFDSQKYGNVFKCLQKKNIIKSIKSVFEPDEPQRSILRLIMDWKYLFKLCYSWEVSACVIEAYIPLLPSFLMRWKLLNPMMYATQGSVDGAIMALTKGWAINFGGGYHHAHGLQGGGFCIYPDISICIKYLFRHYPDSIKQTMIIDCDAHQGNGYARDFMNDDRVYIIDAYNPDIYPKDKIAFQRLAKNTPIFMTKEDDDQSYLEKLYQIEEIIDFEFKPDFILYNAGTDIMKGDKIGKMNITHQGVIDRDELIMRYAFKRGIPILMLFSGGYTKNTAPCIADSIENLVSVSAEYFDIKDQKEII